MNISKFVSEYFGRKFLKIPTLKSGHVCALLWFAAKVIVDYCPFNNNLGGKGNVGFVLSNDRFGDGDRADFAGQLPESSAFRIMLAFCLLLMVYIQNSLIVVGCLPGSCFFRSWLLDTIFHFFFLWK